MILKVLIALINSKILLLRKYAVTLTSKWSSTCRSWWAADEPRSLQPVQGVRAQSPSIQAQV